MVAVQERRLPSAEGKAEIPGAEEVMSCINSVCKLALGLDWRGARLRGHNLPFCCTLGIGAFLWGCQFCCLSSLQTARSRVLGIFHIVIHGGNEGFWVVVGGAGDGVECVRGRK